MPKPPENRIDDSRCSLTFRAVALCVVATGMFAATMTSSCFAWQPDPSDDSTEASNIDDSLLSHSAVPHRDRLLQDRLRRAEAMIARREFASAIAELRSASASEAGLQILVDKVTGNWQAFRDGNSIRESLLQSLPDDALNSYRRQTEPLARVQLLKAVRDSDFETLRALPSRFPMTDSARVSLQHLAARHLDRREFSAADAIGRRLAGMPG
ncbi:MAG: hypothetical protein O2983_05150, partial [Planctomycetota bacterium]|nr:hypothetical protein [Planctomycetota bacterium]